MHPCCEWRRVSNSFVIIGPGVIITKIRGISLILMDSFVISCHQQRTMDCAKTPLFLAAEKLAV
jgi:hypothetical protein